MLPHVAPNDTTELTTVVALAVAAKRTAADVSFIVDISYFEVDPGGFSNMYAMS